MNIVKIVSLLFCLQSLSLLYAMEVPIAVPIEAAPNELIAAVETGDRDLVAKALTERIAQIDASNEIGMTALHCAAEQGDEEIVRLVLEAGAYINALDKKKRTPLCYAAGGKMQAVLLLLSRGANINAFEDGYSPLHCAVLDGQEDIVCLLLERGAKVDERDDKGETPLHYATRNGQPAIVQVLLKYNAQVNSASSNQMTPLHYAVAELNEEIVRLLLAKGADINARNSEGFTVLHTAVGSGSEALVKLLIEAGARVDDADNKGRTPLCIAVEYDTEALAIPLLEAGAEVNVKGEFDSTPLHMASLLGREATARLLLERGATVNAVNNLGCHPLHFAALNAHESVVKLLLEWGAEVMPVNRLNMTPMGIIESHPERRLPEVKMAVFSQLLLFGARRESLTAEGATFFKDRLHPLEYAAFCNNLETYQALLAKLSDEHEPDQRTLSSVLSWSIFHCPRAIDLIIKQGASVDSALLVVQGLLLQLDTMPNNFELLFFNRLMMMYDRLMKLKHEDSKKELLSVFLMQSVCRRKIHLTRCLLERNAPLERAFASFDKQFAYGDARTLLKLFYHMLLIKAPLTQKIFHTKDHVVRTLLKVAQMNMPEELQTRLIERVEQVRKRYFVAIQQGNIEEVRDMIENGLIDPQEQDIKGRTGLILAKEFNREEVSAYMRQVGLKRGAGCLDEAAPG